MGWIGVDLDATLAEWGEGTSNPCDVLIIGKPIPKMVDRIKSLIAAGDQIRIFTARIDPASPEECERQLRRLPWWEGSQTPQRDWVNYQRTLIEKWCEEHLGVILPITATKDFHMYQLFDDRCLQVSPNTGTTLVEYCEELVAKIEYLLETQNLYGPEGFTFPDGDHWEPAAAREREGV